MKSFNLADIVFNASITDNRFTRLLIFFAVPISLLINLEASHKLPDEGVRWSETIEVPALLLADDSDNFLSIFKSAS